MSELEKHVETRIVELNHATGWNNITIVTNERRKALSFAMTDDGVLFEPLFPTFKDGLDFCIKTYNKH